MNEIILLLLAVVGIFAVGCSIALLAMGKIIDGYPTGNESSRKRSLASPIETTKIAVTLFWPLFLLGGWAVLQESRFVLITGVTIIFSICLFMFTALVFPFVVLSAIRGRWNSGTPPLQVPAPIPIDVPSANPVKGLESLQKKHYPVSVSNLMADAIMRKD
jgi:hypothetical protein